MGRSRHAHIEIKEESVARYENAIKDTTFEKEMYKTGTIPNIAGGIYLSTFLLYFNKDIFAGLPLTKCLILV